MVNGVKAASEPVLSIRDLVIEFDSKNGPLRAVDGVSFDVREGEVLCIVGESGSGKSLTMLAVMGLLPVGARIASGSIVFRGQELVGMPDKQRRKIRGRDLAMVFQDPMTSLNPVMRVGAQVAEMIRLHRKDLSKTQVRARVIELLELVRIPNAEARYKNYPHEFSGGMRQRAVIAMSMAHNPALLIADEPTTALDVTIQAQVLGVLREVRADTGSSMALITHDLGVVAEVADRVVVMYGGRVMETGTVFEIFEQPKHPYTVGLLASTLRAGTEDDEGVRGSGPTAHDRLATHGLRVQPAVRPRRWPKRLHEQGPGVAGMSLPRVTARRAISAPR